MTEQSDILRTFISAHRNDDVRKLALQASKHRDIDMNYAVAQIAGWQRAKEKLPRWAATEGIEYPLHLPLEQCSSQLTAEYKRDAIRAFSSENDCPTDTYADLTAGFGVDFCTIAPLFCQAEYVERQEALCRIAENNFPLLGTTNAKVICADGIEVLRNLPHHDWLFLDPARRDNNGGKVVALADCEPNVIELEESLNGKATFTMLKLSPMLDISLALRQLRSVRAIHVVSVDNECKELLLIIGSQSSAPLSITCSNISHGTTETLHFTADEENGTKCIITDEMGKNGFLYEPNTAVLKGGASAVLTKRFGVGKLHPNSNLYFSDELVEEFPGRKFRIGFVCGFGKKEIKEHIAPLAKANLTVRNFPSSVAELRKKLKLREGGDTYIFATTLANGSHALIGCTKA